MGNKKALVILTIGHSTRTLESFIHLLQVHGVKQIIDVRTVPRSRHNPQFNKDTLPGVLKDADIEYVHIPGLGGLRHSQYDSLNTGWRNASFRGFADYMQTTEFMENLEWILTLAKNNQIVLMCAEAVPWRCHRSLIADALTVRGINVEHIMSESRRDLHTVTSFARIDGFKLTYPPHKVIKFSGTQRPLH